MIPDFNPVFVLVAAGVGPEPLVVAGELGEIVGALEGEPSGDRGTQRSINSRRT